MNRRLWLGPLALLAAAALLAACGSGGDGGGMDHGGDDPTTTVAESADFNNADVTFAQGMIPHHKQAVEMADLAEDRAESAEVKDLAAKIKGAQDPEIEQMQGWLEDWDQPEVKDDSRRDMGGMMSDDDMEALESASGAPFDELFLDMMIEHHKGAIEMANIEIKDGKNAAATALAEAIVEAQEAEITQMQDLLDAS